MLPELLSALEGLAVVEALRFSRWTYAFVNATHILGIALLVGGVVPLSLRLLGCWPDVALAAVTRLLVVTAATGLAIAAVTGVVLFSTRASEYAFNPALQAKLVLVLIGLLSAVYGHYRYGRHLETAPKAASIRMAIVSLACWTAALISGRLIAFVEA